MHQTKTIRKKLFVSYTNLIVWVIVAFAIFLFAYISRILSNQTKDMMTSLLTAGINQTDMEIRKMDTISLNISYSELVKGNFERLVYKKKPISASNEQARVIIDAFIAINGPLMPVQQINIYSLNGQVLSTGFANRSMKTQLDLKDWYRPVIKEDGRKYITVLKNAKESYIFEAVHYPTSYVALDRVLFDKYGQQLGILEVITKSKQIFKSISEMEEKYKGTVKAFIFDESGSMIYPSEGGDEPLITYEVFETHKKADKEGFFQTKLGKEKYNFYYSHSDYTGWTVVLARSVKSVINPIMTLALFMLAITSLFIFAALFLAFIMAKDFSNPIKELLLTIKSTQLKNLEAVSHKKLKTHITELEALDTAFRDMSSDLKRSAEATLEAQRQELKARMLALQSQMNPHFLYNTLTNISVMAEEGLNDGIVQMCEHVSFLLRYFSAAKPELVPIKDEFECAKSYLGIIQIRYKEYLRYDVILDKQIEDVRVPRNIIQPLVENAVKYGVNEEMIWNIKVEGDLKDNGWRLTVSDQGCGFTEEIIKHLQEKIDNINTNQQYLDLEINGMGFINVFSRLKLTYGENMFFKFGNSSDGGAFVTIGVKDMSMY